MASSFRFRCLVPVFLHQIHRSRSRLSVLSLIWVHKALITVVVVVVFIVVIAAVVVITVFGAITVVVVAPKQRQKGHVNIWDTRSLKALLLKRNSCLN